MKFEVVFNFSEKVEVELVKFTIEESIINYVRDNFSNEIKEAIKKLAKSERATQLKDVAKMISKNDYCVSNEIEFSTIYEAVSIVKREIVRNMIVNDKVRADGRGLKNVRPITIETNILPSAHSSCLFTRGETQSLTTVTFGTKLDELLQESAAKSEYTPFILHYNFPPFSTGEVKMMRGVGRREVGHGNLAMRSSVS